MAGVRGKSGGHNKLPVEVLKARGTYRPSIHGDRDDAPKLDVPQKPAAKVKTTPRSQERWIRSEADARAVRNGCRFNERLAAHAVEFFPRYLCHSKGRWAGNPFELTDWQREEIIYPIFGWVRENEDGLWVRRFRQAYIEIPKKNGKSTLASGIGLYGLVGDGEPGAEIYSAGADKDQARIVHTEAIHMVEASEELKSALDINRTTGAISYPETHSWYKALSSAASGHQGLNAHICIIDELHEWYGREMWEVLKYAYAARTQPLQFTITNAGDDLESVCREQHDKARGVIDGRIHDDRFFGLVYSIGDDDEWTNIEVARKANPSLGGIIKVEDFAADVQDALDTPSEQGNFKRLRLGIWQVAENPWLIPADWKACAEACAEADLVGRECFGGLDLAKTRDMTAWAKVFPEDDDRFRLVVRFWLPEATAMNPKHKNFQLYRQWADEGWLTLTPGDVCDYAFIKREIIEDSERFQIVDYGFDPWNAEAVTQEIEAEAGVRRVAFRQTIGNFAEPTAEFERLVIGHGLIHDNNPILNWQSEHVSVYTDSSGNKKPVKPKHGDHRKIDGFIASVMGLARAMADERPPVPTWYDDHEVEFV